MRSMRLVRDGDGAVVADDLEVARSFVGRARGLMGRAGLEPAQGLWLEPCNSIHMLFMRFPIDVVFVQRLERGRAQAGSTSEVLKVCADVSPWTGLASCRGNTFGLFGPVTAAVELPAGRAAAVGVQDGDLLRLEVAA